MAFDAIMNNGMVTVVYFEQNLNEVVPNFLFTCKRSNFLKKYR